MGTITFGMAVPETIIHTIQNDKELLRFLLRLEKSDDLTWNTIDAMGFDTRLYLLIDMLRGAGLHDIADAFDVELYMAKKDAFYNFQGYEVWIVKPAVIDFILDGLSNHPAEDIIKRASKNNATDYYGETIPADEYEDYLSALEPFKQLLARCKEKNLYLVLCNC